MNNKLLAEVTEALEKVPNKFIGNNTVNPNWIYLSENKYGFTLPLYYKWFVENYDYIYLWGEMTKTISPPEYQDEADQDIFNYHNLEPIQFPDRLIFLVTEELEEYYFPIVKNQVQEEVFLCDSKNDIDELYAENFLTFLLKEIPKNY